MLPLTNMTVGIRVHVAPSPPPLPPKSTNPLTHPHPYVRLNEGFAEFSTNLTRAFTVKQSDSIHSILKPVQWSDSLREELQQSSLKSKQIQVCVTDFVSLRGCACTLYSFNWCTYKVHVNYIVQFTTGYIYPSI